MTGDTPIQNTAATPIQNTAATPMETTAATPMQTTAATPIQTAEELAMLRAEISTLRRENAKLARAVQFTANSQTNDCGRHSQTNGGAARCSHTESLPVSPYKPLPASHTSGCVGRTQQ